jgi:hypothetical protein
MVGVAVAALAAMPAVASAAGTVSISGSTLTYTGDAGVNDVTVTESGANYQFAETGISVGAGCTDNGDNATCPLAGPTSVVMNMGDGNDVVAATTVNEDPFTIDGQAGEDTLRGAMTNDTVNGGDDDDPFVSGQAGNDVVNGGNGNDGSGGPAFSNRVFGGNGDDTVTGGDGNDRLEGFAGVDTLDGGTGLDRALYGAESVTNCTLGDPIVVSLDNVQNDNGCQGEAANSENVMDTIESVTGSRSGDTITGSCFANTISGEIGTTNDDVGGNDTLRGDPTTGCTPGSSDFLGGGEGSDTLFGDAAVGDAGVDTVTYGTPYTGVGDLSIVINGGAVSNDGWGNTTETVGGTIERVIGNSGNDTLNATAAEQGVQLFGRLGNDTLTDSAFDDLLDGEGGTDTANCTNGGTDTHRGIETNNGCEIAG